MIGIVAAATAGTTAPYLFSRAVDALAQKHDLSAAMGILLVYALLIGLAKAVGQISRFMLFLCAERLNLIGSTAFFAKLLRKTPTFFLEHNQAEIASARQQGTQTINMIVQFGIGSILPGTVQIVVAAILLGSLVNWQTAAIVLVYGTVVILIDYKRVGRVRPFLDKATAGAQNNARLVGNAIALIDTVRQTRGEAWMADRFSAGAKDIFASWRSYVLTSGAFSAALGLAAALQLSVTFLLLMPRATRQGRSP